MSRHPVVYTILVIRVDTWSGSRSISSTGQTSSLLYLYGRSGGLLSTTKYLFASHAELNFIKMPSQPVLEFFLIPIINSPSITTRLEQSHSFS